MIEVFGYSRKGTREGKLMNDDSMFVNCVDNCYLAVVADGVGSDKYGALGSANAVLSVVQHRRFIRCS